MNPMANQTGFSQATLIDSVSGEKTKLNQCDSANDGDDALALIRSTVVNSVGLAIIAAAIWVEIEVVGRMIARW